eukprot:COSAG04_NODE_3190_length_3070_cov_1.758667_3_plen_143_part_00
MTPIMTSMLSVSRTILACIWVAFFQECQQIIVRTGRNASPRSMRRRGTGGCRAGWPCQARGFAAVQHRVTRHRLRRAPPLFSANTCTSRLPPGPALFEWLSDASYACARLRSLLCSDPFRGICTRQITAAPSAHKFPQAKGG